MSTIVCATDLSPESASVVLVGAAMSRTLGWPLELHHIVEVPAEVPPDLLNEELVRDLTGAAQAKLDAQAAPLRQGGLAVITAVNVGFASDVRFHAQHVGAGLLVLGTHARRGAARFVLGSVAERTIEEAACPVLVVPPHAGGQLVAPGAPAKRLRLLCGIDLSPGSDAALDWLRAFRRDVDCDARLVHLYDPAREHERLGLQPPTPFEVDRDVVAVLSRELRAHVEAHLGSDLALRIRPRWGGEADPLAWEAETDDADLLVIGTSQTHRSTALPTVRGSHLPVLCVPKSNGAPAVRALAPVRSVLVPTDFSPAGNAAVADACQLLLPAGGEIVLAHVAKPERLGLDPDRQNEIETCLLGLIPSDDAAKAIHSRTFVTADAAPGEAIVKAVRRFAPDVVVMSAHGRHEGRHGRRGPTTDYVVWNSPKPVMVLPPRGT